MHDPQERTARAVSATTFPEAVRWGQASLAFELRSTDAGLLARAAGIFQSWPAPLHARLSRSWHADAVSPPANEELYEASVVEPSVGSKTPFFRGPRASLIHAIECDAVRELFEHAEPMLGMHCALLSRTGHDGERGVAIVGPSQAGKSTLSCALWHGGWSFLCDDVTLLDDEGVAYPTPRRACLRETSRSLVGETLWARAHATPSCDYAGNGVVFHPHEADGRPRPHSARLAAIIFLARRNVELAPAEARLLAPAHAAIALLPYSPLLKRLPFPSAVARIAALAERVPVYDMGRGPLTAMVAAADVIATASAVRGGS